MENDDDLAVIDIYNEPGELIDEEEIPIREEIKQEKKKKEKNNNIIRVYENKKKTEEEEEEDEEEKDIWMKMETKEEGNLQTVNTIT